MRAFILTVVLALITSELLHGQPGAPVLPDTVKRSPIVAQSDTVGRFIHINRIFIIGNRITREQIILRELSLKSGDIIYSLDLPSMLDLDKKKLINTRLF